MNKTFRFALIAVLCCGGLMAQVSPTMPAPNRNITGSSPHRPPGDHPESTAGNIEGFVYWDVQKVSHVPANSCSGMSITVSVGSSSGGPFTAYTPLGTLSNNFTYLGQVREFLTGGKIAVYDVCGYAYDKVPVGPVMQVKLTVTQPTAFSAGATPQFEILGPISIINAQCNMLPRISSPTSSDLVAHWGSCQNMAYDVNFTIVHPGAQVARTPSTPGNVLLGANSGTSASPLLKDPGPGGAPMLSGAPNQGMLTNGPGAMQSPAANGGMQQNRAPVAPAKPQPLPPRSAAPRGDRTALKPIKLGTPKALRKTINPRLAEQNAGIIAILRRQRNAAQQETAAMKLDTRSIASVRGPAATTLQGGTRVQNFGPETAQSEGKLSSGMVHAVPNSIVLMCASDPTPRIFRLSGGESQGILTPEAKYNLYTITGCGFGPSDPGNSAYIYGVNGFKVNFNIDFWSDNGITVHLDPWLAGVFDQDNVTLVVAPTGKQPFNKSGYKFYAARGMPGPDGNDQDVALAYDSMPNASVSLFDASPVLAGYDRVPPNGTSQFPSFSFQGTPVAGWVFRYAYGHIETYSGLNGTDCFINDIGYPKTFPVPAPCVSYFGDSPPIGSDTWDFSKLAPGFVISAYDLYYEDPDPNQVCGSWDDYTKNSGLLLNWDFNLTAPTQITVTWPLYWCKDTELPPSGRINEQKQSVYGLAVWVLGPRCINPWTGQKDQNCMNTVKQTLS
jgi:hypothetical protein